MSDSAGFFIYDRGHTVSAEVRYQMSEARFELSFEAMLSSVLCGFGMSPSEKGV